MPSQSPCKICIIVSYAIKIASASDIKPTLFTERWRHLSANSFEKEKAEKADICNAGLKSSKVMTT